MCALSSPIGACRAPQHSPLQKVWDVWGTLNARLTSLMHHSAVTTLKLFLSKIIHPVLCIEDVSILETALCSTVSQK